MKRPDDPCRVPQFGCCTRGTLSCTARHYDEQHPTSARALFVCECGHDRRVYLDSDGEATDCGECTCPQYESTHPMERATSDASPTDGRAFTTEEMKRLKEMLGRLTRDYEVSTGTDTEVLRAKVERNMSTPESRAFWKSAKKSAAEVASWPAWKRAGINVAQMRDTTSATDESCRHCGGKGEYEGSHGAIHDCPDCEGSGRVCRPSEAISSDELPTNAIQDHWYQRGRRHALAERNTDYLIPVGCAQCAAKDQPTPKYCAKVSALAIHDRLEREIAHAKFMRRSDSYVAGLCVARNAVGNMMAGADASDPTLKRSDDQ